MKQFIKKYWLHIACVVIWALVAVMLIVMMQKITVNDKKQQQKQQSIELVETNNLELKGEISPILLDSINLFITEDEKLIAEGVRAAYIKYKVPPYVIFAIIATESNRNGTNNITEDTILNVNPRAKSNYNCIGLMQVSQYAVDDYNKINGTEYTLNDMYRIRTNIEVGTWYYTQFRKVAYSWTEMYVIYNVGYGNYSKVNYYWFYDTNGIWHNEYKNAFFYMNNVYPPYDSNHGLGGKNTLAPYNAKKRFERCLNICYNLFN